MGGIIYLKKYLNEFTPLKMSSPFRRNPTAAAAAATADGRMRVGIPYNHGIQQ